VSGIAPKLRTGIHKPFQWLHATCLPEKRTSVTFDEIDVALRDAPNMTAAATMVRIHRSHLHRLIRHFGIDLRAKSTSAPRQ
jgi:hypothetical protein